MLTRQQIKLVQQKIADEGVETPELAEDLLDHLCVVIEKKMEGAQSFEDALESTFDELEDNELEITEKRTQELLEGRKIYYPNLLQSVGLLGLTVGIVILETLIFIPLAGIAGSEYDNWMNRYYPFYVAAANTIALGAAIFFAVKRIHSTQKRAILFSFREVPAYVYGIVLAVVLLSTIWTEPLMWLNVYSADRLRDSIERIFGSGLMVAVSVVTLNAILVELLLRGIILKGLLMTMTPLKAIAWTSLFAVVMSAFAYPFTVFAINVLVGWVYWKTKSLNPVILMSVSGAVAGILTAYYFGNPDRLLFAWRSLIDNTLVYGGTIALTFISTVLLLRRLDKRTGERMPIRPV